MRRLASGKVWFDPSGLLGKRESPPAAVSPDATHIGIDRIGAEE